jgi:hypothetical protein
VASISILLQIAGRGDENTIGVKSMRHSEDPA